MSFFVNECFVCKTTDSPIPCSRCYMISYCGPGHQKEDWPKHKDFCDVIWALVRQKKVSHIYETLCGVDLETWIKERKRICWIVKSKLRRPLLLQEEQMLLMPRSCFVCHNTRQDLLTTCSVCFCANFCAEHPSSSEHEKNCLSLKLFREFDGKMQNPAKLRTIFSLIDKIAETTKFENSSDIPQSMKEYLDQQIKGEDHILEQACVSNILSMSLTLFNALKKLNLQSASKILLHIRCDVTDSVIWELLLHFLPNLQLLNIVFIEQGENQKLVSKVCDDCTSKNKMMILETNELLYKNYVKVKTYKKPDVFVYLNAEISKSDDENLEWKFLLENLSRLGCPLVLTSVTEKMAKVISASLRSTFWPSLICYEGPNEFGALEPLREWTDGGVSKINQLLIITLGRTTHCKAGFFYHTSLISKKRKDKSRNPLLFFYTNVCHVCRSENISIFCKYCNMIFYCSEPHRKDDWSKHKELCQGIQRLLKQSGMKNIFDGEIDLIGSQKTDPGAWLQAKINLIAKTESQIGKKLWVFQQQMFLFPKSCFVCHETDFSKLKDCECGINLCKRHKESLSHKEICKDFHLSLQLFEKEKLPDPLPKSKYVSGEKENLPGSIEEFIDLHLILESEASMEKTTNLNPVVIGELLTKPLTLLYAIKKLMITEFKKDNNSENNSTIVVHVIGSKNTENIYYEFWDVFFNWMQNLEKLSISFVGPETTTLNLNRSFPELKERNLSIKSYPVDYEQFVQSSFFVKPDIVVGYNLDIHECEDEKCSCKANILTIKKLNVPFLMTSGSKERAQKDHEVLFKILKRPVAYDFCDLNPFASLVPERDFETEGLRFSNKYLLLYCDLDQTSDADQNSKLRKYLHESLDAKKLTDYSHLSDLEKALRAMKIEIAPVSSIENAESKTRASNPRNSFLFEAARHELKFMLRSFEGASTCDGCKSSVSKKNSGPDKDEQLSITVESESKSELGYSKNEISEENLSATQDSEHKLESKLTVDEVFEEDLLSATKDSESQLAIQKLFKKNVISTIDNTECNPQLGTENIWNVLFTNEDLESKSGSEIANTECESKSKSESVKDKIFKKNLVSSITDSESTSENGLTDASVKEDVLLKLSTAEDPKCNSETRSPNVELFKEKILFTEDSELKLKSEYGNDEIVKEDLLSTIEDSASRLEFESADIETLQDDLLPTTVDSESKPESESLNNQILKSNLKTLKNDSVCNSLSGPVDDLVIEKLLEILSPESSECDLETDECKENSVPMTKDFIHKLEVGSSKEIGNSESKLEYRSDNLETFEEDLLLTTVNSESKSETGPSEDELFKNVLSATEDLETQLESGTADEKLKKDILPNIEDSESKSETGPPKDKLFKENVFIEDLETKLESGTAEEKLKLDLLITTENSESKSKSEPLEDELSKENLLSTTEDLETKSGPGTVEERLKEDLLLTTEYSEFKSESGPSKEEFIKEKLSPTTKDVKSKSVPKTVEEKLKGDLLITTENSVFKSETGPLEDELFEENLLSTTEDLEIKSGPGIVEERFKEDLLPLTENSEFKSETEPLKNEFLKENLSSTIEDFEEKSGSGFEMDKTWDLEEYLLSSTADSIFKSESQTANGEPLKEDIFPILEEYDSKTESAFTNGDRLKGNLLLSTVDSESKLESGSLKEEVLKENLFSTDDSESKSESGDVNVEISKDDILSTNDRLENYFLLSTEDSQVKLEFGADNGKDLLINSEKFKFQLESGFTNGETLKEGALLNTEHSRSKVESASLKDEILKENLNFSSCDSESKSESVSTNVGVLKDDLLPTTEDLPVKPESGSVNDLNIEDYFLDLVSIKDSESNSEIKVPDDKLFIDSSFSRTEDSESKPDNIETPKEDVFPNTEDFKSEQESIQVLDEILTETPMFSTEDSESKLDSGSSNDEILKVDLFCTTKDSDSNFETEFDNGETLEEDLLPTTEGPEFKSEFGFSNGEICKNVLSAAEQEFEFNSDHEIDNDEKLKENLLPTTQESESKSESISLTQEGNRLLFKTENSISDAEPDSAKEKILKQNLLSLNEEFLSKLEFGSTNVETLLITENSILKSESDYDKNTISEKNLLSSPKEDYKSESESEIANGETLSETEDSEEKLESGRTNSELFRENLLLKKEIRRLKEIEELIKSENSQLKDEIRRLQKVQ